jgi:hypothetical protein
MAIRRLAWTAALVVGGLGVAPRAASPADEAVDAYRRVVRTLETEEKAEAEDLPTRILDALATRRHIRAEFRAGQRATLDDGDVALRGLFAPFVAREARRAEALRALARSGAPRAGAVLLDALFDNAVLAEALDQELLEGRPVAEGQIHDQGRAFRRSAVARRDANLLEAFPLVADAAAALGGDTWGRLAAAEGRRTAARRIAFLDAAGRLPPPAGLALLADGLSSDLPCLRMAALEAAARQGPPAQQALDEGLRDAHTLVRRTALSGLRVLARKDGRSLPAVAALLARARGAEREEVLATLRLLAGCDLGPDGAAWSAWVSLHLPDIGAGQFDATHPPSAPAEAVAAAPPPRLFRVPLTTDRIVFVCDWTLPMVTPADVAFARTRKRIDWFGGDDGWVGRDGQRRLETVVRSELSRTLETLPADARFGLVVLRDGGRDAWPRIEKDSVLGVPRLLKADRAAILEVDRALGDVPPGWSRWHETMDGLWHAATVAGLPPCPVSAIGVPAADTLVLVSSGEVRGGRFVLPEEAVAAFARWNRFRRLVVHTIRVADDGRDAETLLRGLAEATGGRYVHVTRAP